MFDLATSTTSHKLINEFASQNKIVSAVCHGPAALAYVKTSSGSYLLDGHAVTGFSTSEEDAVGLTSVMPFILEDQLNVASGGKFEKAGADWGEKVVVSGKIITGQVSFDLWIEYDVIKSTDSFIESCFGIWCWTGYLEGYSEVGGQTLLLDLISRIQYQQNKSVVQIVTCNNQSGETTSQDTFSPFPQGFLYEQSARVHSPSSSIGSYRWIIVSGCTPRVYFLLQQSYGCLIYVWPRCI